MRRSGSAHSQSGPDQRSGWLSEADSDQEHLSRKSLWMGQSHSDALLAHTPGTLGLWTRSFLAQKPIYPLVVHVNLSFWLSSFFLIPFPGAQRGRMALGIQRQNAGCCFSLCSFIPSHPSRPVFLLYHPPLSLIRIWNRGFVLISTLCQESPVCHSNPLSCGYGTNNKTSSQPKFPPGTWLSLGFSLGFQKQYLSFPIYPGINKPYFSPCLSRGIYPEH